MPITLVTQSINVFTISIALPPFTTSLNKVSTFVLSKRSGCSDLFFGTSTLTQCNGIFFVSPIRFCNPSFIMLFIGDWISPATASVVVAAYSVSINFNTLLISSSMLSSKFALSPFSYAGTIGVTCIVLMSIRPCISTSVTDVRASMIQFNIFLLVSKTE